MDVTAEDFRRHYESLSDEALLEIDTEELVKLARTCHAEEVARRGLDTSDSGEEGAAGEAASEPGPGAAAEERVCIVEYDYMDEADLARGLLEAADISVTMETETNLVRLLVPAALAEQAVGILATPLSDEELAAQAEAAGLAGEFEEAEEAAEDEPEEA